MSEQPHPNWHWRDGPVDPAPAVVFDMDGVISDATGRQHLLQPPRRDWDAFFAACGDDALFPEVARLMHVIDQGLHVILLTARPLDVQPQTLEWLERHELRWDLLLMRPWGDYTASRAFKRESVSQLRTYGFELTLAFEDDRRNVDMFHDEGVPCVYLHSGYYE